MMFTYESRSAQVKAVEGGIRGWVRHVRVGSVTFEEIKNMSADTTTEGFRRGLGLFDSVMVVVGVMVGSGIFIVSAEMSRQIGVRGGCWWLGG